MSRFVFLAMLGLVGSLGTDPIIKPCLDADETEAVAPSVPQGLDPTLAIDLFTAAHWQRQGTTPSESCGDQSFVRRLYLDLIGRIPSLDETDAFLHDTHSDKRNHLIDRLLSSHEHALHMTDVFDAYLMGRKGSRATQERRRHGWREYLRSAFRANRAWDRMARDMVLARATPETDVRGGWFLYERKNKHQQIAEAVAPSFFGIRIECAQCHDHPLASEIQQHHYWGLVAFFNRGKNTDSGGRLRVAESAVGGFGKFTDLAGDNHDTLLTFFESATIDEARPRDADEPQDTDDKYLESVHAEEASHEPKVPRFSRRQKFTDEVLSDHPLVAVAFVNRMWALFLGRGLVHPVDKIDSMHPPSHPELLQWLAEDFRRHGYDIRRLIRHLVRSRCYQLDSQPLDDNAQPQDFAYALDKPLTAESFLRSIDFALKGHDRDVTDELLERFRQDFPDVFAESHNSTLTQALMLTNHPEINAMFRANGQNTIDRLSRISDTIEQVRLAFQIAFHRPPSDEESRQSVAFLNAHQDRCEALGQFFWALVMSAEFRINH